MSKAIFLDRDGTINVDRNYLYRIEDFEFLPNAIEALKILQQAGYLLIIVTNQSGIGRGYYSEEDYHKLNNWMLEILENQGIYIRKVFYCPHVPDAKIEKYKRLCSCRKPKPGMYIQAMNEFQIEWEQSYAIGDKIRDCAICKTTACQGFLIGNNERADIIELVKNNGYPQIKYAIDLYESAKEICFNTR